MFFTSEKEILELLALVLVIPYLLLIMKIIKKAGINPWWALLSITPAIIPMLWVFAFIKWPALPNR